MQCFCTCVRFHVFCLCVSVRVLFLFHGSPWSDSNKERKRKKDLFIYYAQGSITTAYNKLCAWRYNMLPSLQVDNISAIRIYKQTDIIILTQQRAFKAFVPTLKSDREGHPDGSCVIQLRSCIISK